MYLLRFHTAWVDSGLWEVDVADDQDRSWLAERLDGGVKLSKTARKRLGFIGPKSLKLAEPY